MLRYTDITGKDIDKVQTAIERLKAFEPKDGYYLAFSGGKDSCCIKALADMAGVRYDAHYSVTTVDPPELVRFIKEKHPDVIFNRPVMSMRKLIVKHLMLPTRVLRYCCKSLKEANGKGRIVMTGVRWAESNRRKAQHGIARVGKQGETIILNDDNDESRRMVENCYRTKKTMINPIVDWLDEDVWEFIRTEKLPYCCLYDEGFKRLGCVGCPMAGKMREDEFRRWPQYERLYRLAIKEMLGERIAKGKPILIDSVDGVWDWWMGKTVTPDANQTMLDMDTDEDDAEV